MKKFVSFSVVMAGLSLFLFIFFAVNFWNASSKTMLSYLSFVVFLIVLSFLGHYLSKLLIAKKHDRMFAKMNFSEMPKYLQEADEYKNEDSFFLSLSILGTIVTVPWVWFSLIHVLHLK